MLQIELSARYNKKKSKEKLLVGNDRGDVARRVAFSPFEAPPWIYVTNKRSKEDERVENSPDENDRWIRSSQCR